MMKQLKTTALRIGKFAVTGLAAALVEFLIFLLIHDVLDQHDITAHIISFFCGMAVSFLLNQIWVFGQNRNNILRNNIKYIVVALVNLGLGTVLLSWFVSVGIASAIAKILVMVIIGSWNYMAYRIFVFR